MRYKINIISKMLVGLAVLALCAMAIPAPSAQAREYRLVDFMILVDDQLIIKGAADVYVDSSQVVQGIPRRSDLGSRNFIQIGGKLSTRIPVDAPTVLTPPGTNAGAAIIAQNVTLGNFAKVHREESDQVLLKTTWGTTA